MAIQFQIKAEDRSGPVATARNNGKIPAVLYGHGVKPQNIEVDNKLFTKVYNAAGSTSLVNVSLADKEHTVLIREIQFHPVKSNILHIDFYQVRMDQEIHAEVSLNFTGEAPAVKDLSGVLVRNLDKISVKALPNDLPHDIEIDISILKDFDKVIHISDLDLPKGVEIMNDPEEVITLVQAPRTEEEIEALEEEITEDVESVEGIKEEAEEGEEEGEEGEKGAEEGEKPDEKTEEADSKE